MTAQLSRSLHDGESAVAWGVVAENIEWVLAGVEARGACLYFALVLVGAADLELVAAAGQVLLEPLVGGDDLFNLGLLLAGHDSVL